MRLLIICKHSCIEFEFVGNSQSVSQSLTLDRIDKVKHYIKIKIHTTVVLTQQSIILRFWG